MRRPGFARPGVSLYRAVPGRDKLCSTMPTLDDVYLKFGFASEAAQLLETELGNILLAFGALDGRLLSATPDKKRAADLFADINRQTLGQLIKNAKRHVEALTQLEPLLLVALDERNRLSHHFFRQHNLRRNSDEGRALMLADLESIHDVLLEAFKAVTLLSGVDLDAMVKEGKDKNLPTRHLPI
jgi:hypothetical protein